MINRVVLIGHLTKDLNLKYTGQGTAVGSFTVAVNRTFTNQNGEREADFINCVIWRKPAENLANFTHKGSLIGIEGRLQTRNYDNQQGQKVYVTEVIVDNFSLLESKNSDTKNNSFDNSLSQQQAFNQNESQHLGINQNNNWQSTSTEIDISDDTLPF